ncbi:hypothetical protein A4G17_02575 [Frederiksenia canicola]|uniref:Uncharacterized protein n=1 Tax=Frederiksenia canicola TaxID=123824 RepID=A0AAE6X4Z1_9PAST|nr:hypothetical protein A4G17_02575 [Frederiksenia canicola]RPE91974.1 hypothetical protein EDC49_1772 [Frederiksenia canicola]
MSKAISLIKESFVKSVLVMFYIIFLIWVKLFISTGEVDHFYYIFSSRLVLIYIKLFPFLWGLCFCVLFANNYFASLKNK